MSRFQILSLIGGGIRGAFVTSYLKELEQKSGRNIAETFSMIDEQFFQHTRHPFTPLTTAEGEIVLNEFGFD